MPRSERESVLRLALTPRWLAAALAVLVVGIACVLLGRWQWDRTQSILAAERAAQSEPIVVEDALSDAGATTLPPESIGRPVIVHGSYAPDLQVAVTAREHDGVAGVWIVTGLRLEDGRTVAVVRGWLPDAAAPGSAAPAGPVTVNGVMQPDETFYAGAETAPGTVVAVDHERLEGLWGTDVTPGFVVLTDEDPQSDPAPVPVDPVVKTGDVDFPLQNFVYAFQWWLFALFGIAVFLRWLWLENRRRRASSEYGVDS